MNKFEIVCYDGLQLKYVKEQTPEICIEAVKENGMALKYVKEQTPEICMEAVKQQGWALTYVEEQTPEICMEAIKQNSMALYVVKEQTLDLCVFASKFIDQNNKLFLFFEFINEEIIMNIFDKTSYKLYEGDDERGYDYIVRFYYEGKFMCFA